MLTADVLVEQSEDLEASQKYTLRALLNGIDTVEDLELFLGLDEGDTGRAVAGLLRAEYISYQPPADGGLRRLELLPTGQEAARHAQLRRPTSTTIPVVYDRLTGAVTDWRRTSLRRSHHAKADAGRILLPPASSMPVRTTDLSIAALTSTLDTRTRDGARLLGISGVTENRNFYHDAILLVFADEQTLQVRLGVEVDGKWSEPHTAALEAIGAVDRLRLSAAPVEHPHEPVTAPGDRLSRTDVLALQAAGDGPAGEDAGATLNGAAIRWLGVYEHPAWLDDALVNSRRRLLIGSPQIRTTVATGRWIRTLEKLSRTVDVTIVWGPGIGDGTDRDAVDALHAAARRSNRLTVVRVAHAPARLLVSDGSYITTSFNWLSFRGEPSRTYRQDDGELIQDEHLTDRAYDTYMTEACAQAVEVVGTLPAKYRDPADPGTSLADQRPVPDTRMAPEKRRPAKPSPAERRRAALTALTAGETVTGAVKTLTSFGAFISLGDVDGLIHISQLADRRVQHPSEVLSVGETVTALVLNVDVERQRVSLSLKAAPAPGSAPAS
ncbi:S1 RNA-binding domain-containing protein [Actinoplanes flavus]|uniref:S1 RNA-binding domain-containing protein n=1 Tax=Actinoplanes flavus TaxID=2820290 RepID=A0ABS3UDS8_9ACTN|nr:S1 RNA-binding domain-containing protein [Actinoplanes flavus]MBO3736601.1 S1 RNA-binding domain-containing protein [Actinoplanes flavus]